MITKAVIPCGGLGTRFLPITKAVAKEMLPIIDKPCLDYIVDELVEAGITDILLIISPDKNIIKEYYLPNIALNKRLEASGKTEALKYLQQIEKKVRLHYAIQHEAKGSGHAMALAESFAAGEPFIVALGDDVMFNPAKCVTRQIMDVFEKYQRTVFAVQTREVPEILKYGVIDIENQAEPRVVKMRGIIEKPKEHELTSNLCTLGRYAVTPKIFDIIRKTPVAKTGELQFTDSLNLLVKHEGGYAYSFEGIRYDLGDKLESIKAIVEYGLRSEFGKELGEYLEKVIKSCLH